MIVISLADMRAHLGLTDDFGADDDVLIVNKVAAATAHVEAAAGLSFDDFETVDAVPADLKEAIRMLAAHLYENREASIVGVSASAIPFGFDDLVRPHRAEWF
ncbi:hypothetical protein GCM10008171_19610 [Methylopila jiangsuensis]|uniref:Phage gp6-like head-tail connector protein n=1 Tax=Methylopila jiangsuensis TaxID=586230 RepID=A0A9W6N432_9HYPH|nr:head-tail connector protein [Methylopila jiangsuensis]MDR6286943.1 hypothetical protein [Methylopila jiangsuensis]GLK76707.1 hypothetical protein GCM10008171_19610 [Methylopila jiangsuensis]